MKKTNKKNSTARKLLPAFAMLTVSAISLSSATYAWFSMNKEVSVTSMTIAAKSADAIIEISANGTDFYNDLYTTAPSDGSANWTLPDATDVKLKLVTPTAIEDDSNAPNPLGTVSWGWAASSNHADAEVSNATTAKALTGQSTPAKTESNRAQYLGIASEDLYVLTQKFTIRNVSADVNAANLKISEVKINKGSNTIANSVRVLFVAADGKYALYKPDTSNSAAAGSTVLVSDHQWLDPALNAPATDMEQTSSSLPIIASSLTAKGTGSTPATGSSTDVDVYVFFDGTDASAYTDNATDLSAVTVDFTFAID